MITVSQDQFDTISGNLNRILKERFSMPLSATKLNEVTAEALGYNDFRTYQGMSTKQPSAATTVTVVDVQEEGITDILLFLNGEFIMGMDTESGNTTYVRQAAENLAQKLGVEVQMMRFLPDERMLDEGYSYNDIQSKLFGEEAKERDNLIKDSYIEARAVTDDHHFDVKFNAASWFVDMANDQDILELPNIGWGGDKVAYRLLDFVAQSNPEISTLQRHGYDVGYKCYVNKESAMKWLMEHRRDLWEQIAREYGQE